MKKLVAALAMWILIPAVASAGTANQSPPSTDPNPSTQQQPAPDQKQDAPIATAQTATTTANVSGKPPPNATPEQLASESGFHVGIDLDHWLGTGTFVNSAYYSYLSGNLSVGPTYAFKAGNVKLIASTGVRVGLEYTLPDNENGRRLTWRDLRFGLSAPAVYKERHTGISLSPNVSYTLPITMESMMARSLGSLGAGASLSRNFIQDRLNVRYSIGGSRGLYQSGTGGTINPVYANNRDAQGNLVYLCRQSDLTGGGCGNATNNTDWALSNGISLGFSATEKIHLDAGYSLIHTWKHSPPVDEFTPKAVDSNGNPVARDQALADIVFASVGVSYQLTDIFSVSGGIATIAPPKTKDNKAFRFPLYDFIGPADNNTTFSLAFSASL